ncbi:hypothetical protein L1987_45307 [Smallanthus sonchifolius]|uniref:Uncharacterized protein n=1 Tax=Smallanthus sonchifolius TaxID=185202 RepID=A0ACB9GSX3_9ASTR|nr:hypothetical protein L1987_45307 [Smallanthus sonchifolius]
MTRREGRREQRRRVSIGAAGGALAGGDDAGSSIDEGKLGMLDMQDMRDCYDSLLTAAASTKNTAYVEVFSSCLVLAFFITSHFVTHSICRQSVANAGKGAI